MHWALLHRLVVLTHVLDSLYVFYGVIPRASKIKDKYFSPRSTWRGTRYWARLLYSRSGLDSREGYGGPANTTGVAIHTCESAHPTRMAAASRSHRTTSRSDVAQKRAGNAPARFSAVGAPTACGKSCILFPFLLTIAQS